jgi:hypothetical protein
MHLAFGGVLVLSAIVKIYEHGKQQAAHNPLFSVQEPSD